LSFAKVETLRWIDGRLEMIDQTRLPAVFEYMSYGDAVGVAKGIRDMVVRGAPAIGVAAAFGVALEGLRSVKLEASAFYKALDEAFEVLSKSRPTAVNLFWALQRMRDLLNRVRDKNTREIADILLAEAKRIYEEDIAINKKIGINGASLLSDRARVLTHCNAGALATAGHGTALGVIRSAVELGKSISVYADETRPFLQGARLTAWEMVQEGIPTTLIADNMSGFLMSQGEVDAIIVGTDRVAANGDVANKIGTYMVAVLAKEHGIPFYVACPLSTIDMSVESGADIPIEERSENEVLGYRDIKWAADGVKVRNPAFDVTPARFVTALITEVGIVESPNKSKLEKLFLN